MASDSFFSFLGPDTLPKNLCPPPLATSAPRHSNRFAHIYTLSTFLFPFFAFLLYALAIDDGKALCATGPTFPQFFFRMIFRFYPHTLATESKPLHDFSSSVIIYFAAQVFPPKHTSLQPPFAPESVRDP